MEELNTNTDNFVQESHNAPNNIENNDINVADEIDGSDKNVMREAVDSVQAKNKGAQKAQTQIQKIKIKDREYEPQELEKQFSEIENYKKGMYQAFEERAKYEKALKYINDQFENGDIIDLLARNDKYRDKLDKSIQKYAEQQIRWHQMTPEQRQYELDRQQGLNAKQELEQIKQQQQQYQKQQLEQHYVQEYNAKFKDQIEARGLPFHDLDIKEMAMTIAGGIQRGEDIDWESAAEQVMSRRSKSYSSWMESLANKDPEGNLLVKFTPKSVLNAYRKYLTNQVKQSARQPKSEAPQSYSPPVKQKTMTPQEWRQLMKQI